MHFVWAAATDALGSRMCRWWFARARKLHYSLRLALLYKFVGETAAALNLLYNAFFFSFHRRINEIRRRNASPQIQRYEFFFIFKMNLPLIFPLAFIPYSLFCQYKFSVIFFSLVVAGRKKLKYHWNHLNFAVGFLFHPENFSQWPSHKQKEKKNSTKSPVRLVSLWYNFFMSLGK